MIVQLGSRYATCLGVKTPRMLSWNSNQMIQKDHLAEDLNRKKVNIFKYSGIFSVFLSISSFFDDLSYYSIYFDTHRCLFDTI